MSIYCFHIVQLSESPCEELREKEKTKKYSSSEIIVLLLLSMENVFVNTPMERLARFIALHFSMHSTKNRDGLSTLSHLSCDNF